LLSIELPLVLAVRRLPLDGTARVALGEAAADPGDAARRQLQGLGDAVVAPGRTLRAIVGFQQDASPGLLAGGGFAPTDEFDKPLSI
jgi:hypothetical protein